MNIRGEHGYTPLHLAAEFNTNPTVITALVDAGAEVNIRGEHGYTPLHLAAESNTNPTVIEVLLDAGADAGVRAAEGKTPWDLAKDRDELKGSDAYRRLNDVHSR